MLLIKEIEPVGYSRRLALIAEYTPTIPRVVGRFLRKYPTAKHLRDDLESVGNIALVSAVKRLQAGRVDNFPAFLAKSIWWHCMELLRAEDTIHVPRGVKVSRVEMPEVESPRINIDCELIDRIHACCLDETDRLVVALKAIGKTQQEVAAELGVCQNTVCLRLQAIAERLEEYGKP